MPTVLADLRRLEPQLRAFNAATPEIHVVLSGKWAGDDTVMQRLYTEIANLGYGWEFVCPQDISRLAAESSTSRRTPVCRGMPARPLADLSANVRIVFADSSPLADEYGHPVPASLLDAIVRLRVPPTWCGAFDIGSGRTHFAAVCRSR